MVIFDRPAGVPFDLVGRGPIGPLNFQASSSTAGGEHTVSVSGERRLPAQVDVLNESISWMAKMETDGEVSGECNIGNSGAHKIYVTWGTPAGSSPTHKRIWWVCTTAKGATTQEECADKIWDGVAEGTMFGPGDTDGWALLDGGQGDCDNQARCMKYAVEMLGAGPEKFA
ncbi:MAG: hypothetical protein K6T99_00040 [Armatimonadetes bacterium]|nr:hypothetical protein [Armatimonadota bacterium]